MNYLLNIAIVDRYILFSAYPVLLHFYFYHTWQAVLLPDTAVRA